ncbi:uncharacterized protein BDR25DRAFT_280115, partial [Lindgomyces ingoldianus]
MTCTSEPSEQPTRESQDLQSLETNDAIRDTTHAPFTKGSAEPPSPSTKRSEVLRYVFPRPRGAALVHHRSAPRVTKQEHRRSTLSSIKQSKSRVAFQRVITSIFHNNPTRVLPHTARQRTASNASSVRSQPGSVYDSIPSLDVISPGTFLFSGPSLRSARSGSLSNSTSRLPSLTETGSESHSIRRVRSESFSVDSLSVFDESILEPFVENGITRSLFDVLHGISTPFEELEGPIIEDLNEDRPDSIGEHLHLSLSNASCLNTRIPLLLVPYLDSSSQNAMKWTCQSWHMALSYSIPPKQPSAHSLPIEILQHIYSYLAPKGFNAARHTCHTWMRASLNKKLLATMLGRGGWWSSAEFNLNRRNRIATCSDFATRTSDEWFLSRRLSRECSLSGAWTGNGLDAPRDHNAIVEVSQTEFTDLANGYPGSEGRLSSGLIFTTSICGRLLLVARETLIFVYELQSAHLRPLTSVSCPRRVLSMSMDMSSGRNAIAALLEGRMGMVCELRLGHDSWENLSEIPMESHGHPCRSSAQSSIHTSGASEFEVSMDVADHGSFVRPYSSRRSADEQEQTSFNSIDVQSNHDAISLQGTDDQNTYGQNWINHTWNLKLRAAPIVEENGIHANSTVGCARSIPIETGTSTFYRHLCSEDDPPRSVSICPQRRCVAFGCSAGIELHWVDALTEQSLSRWFPLTAPSDYLYFLPPRPGFESAKKLRLISSAAHPEDRPAISRKFFTSRPTVSSFWGSFGFENIGNRSGIATCDHYRAVPLSDGHHVLFIDPPSGNLFLGCDAPLGGPTKLLRKILFIPPEQDQLPRIYTAAADLSWGARVAVVFGDNIVLYSVPPDVFTLSRLEQKAESWDVYTAPPFSTEGRTRDHWLN